MTTTSPGRSFCAECVAVALRHQLLIEAKGRIEFIAG